ncbi:MAG: hypothetical protein ACHQXL_07820 [Candidatus Limnocylindrales bacterium]
MADGPSEHTWLRRASTVGLFIVALGAGVFLARPIGSASIGFDSQVAVLDFDRLLAGRQLEQALTTTPKPLLTFVYGPLELITRDWRSVAWATLLAFAAAVVLTAELARRAGGIAAWAFVGVGLAGSAALLFDVGYALAVPWALLGWSIAGLAIERARPRYGIAGLALLLACLARIETVAILGLALLVLILLRLPAVRRWLGGVGIGQPPGRAWLVLVGFGAFPIMALHDAFIYGQPLFWLNVAGRYSAGTTNVVLSPSALLGSIAEHYLDIWPLVALALVGAWALGRGRTWALLIGIVALGPGLIVLLLALAWRHVYVPDRYLAATDIAVIVAAGMGLARLLDLALERFSRSRPTPASRSRTQLAAAVGLSIIVAVVTVWPSGILDPGLRAGVAASLDLATNVDQMEPTLQGIVDRTPGARAWPPAVGVPALLLVPLPYRPRLAIDLGLPTTMLGDAGPWNRPASGQPVPGQFVVLSPPADGASGSSPYETSAALTLDGVRIVPVASDPGRGWWISAIEPAP